MTEQLACQILDLLKTIQEATFKLMICCRNNQKKNFEILSNDILDACQSILPEIQANSKTESLYLACESIIDSLERVISLNSIDPMYCERKIEFELLPLIQNLYVSVYFFEIVSKNEESLKLYFESERFVLGANKYIDKAEKLGEYKYELSIVVVGFNKLEYTRLCVESLLKHIPTGLNYELILVNHGSTDGTKEFFESIRPHKQIDILRNGGGLRLYSRILEGEYMLIISNDVLVTENAIENMLACIKSDSAIAYVVPTTPNTSNMQGIPSTYSTIEEMLEFAKVNNVLNPLRWEQRTRLCNPICMCSAKHIVSSKGVQSVFYTLTDEDIFIFPDDKLSLLLRRRGLKMMLAKDAYCYHFGSVTIKDEMSKINEQEAHNQGRLDFFNAFGVDPWGTGFCYDINMLVLVITELLEIDRVNILGINSGLGSNPLKIKELYKEEMYNLNATVYNITDQQNYLEDLRGVSNYVKLVENINNAFTSVDKELPEKFHHIVIDTLVSPLLDYIKLIKKCVEYLEDNGSLYAVIAEGYETQLYETFPKATFSKNWVKIKRC